MKNALITGATGSIGGAIATQLARDGWDVALHYNTNEKRAFELAREIKSIGQRVFVIKADIGDIAEIRKMVEESSEKLGLLDLLVNCAATFIKTPFEEVTERLFDDIIKVNLRAAFFIAQEAAGAMRDGSRMIFLSDTASEKPYAGYLPYSMAKAGVDAFVKGLAKKLAPRISVNAIAPFIVTRPKDMSDTDWNNLIGKTPARCESSPEEIAQIVSFLANASPSPTGRIITADEGRSLCFP